MDRIEVADVLYATGGKLISGSADTHIDYVCIDSREVNTNSLFIAIPGEHTDGHRYLENAFKSGASCAMISREVAMPKGMSCVLVDDTVCGLQKLSKWYMTERLCMKKIAITGSVGKTTTRDLLFSAVSGKYKAGKNMKNYNNSIGLPMTILSFDSEMEVGVLEMGTMGEMGEIAVLADIGNPDAAIITNIGVSHMETLGSRDNILKTKMEITKNFTDKNSLIINADDDKLSEINDEDVPFNIVRVGSKNALCDVDYLVGEVEDRGLKGVKFSLVKNKEIFDVNLPIPGAHNAINAALAIAAAGIIGISPQEAIENMNQMTTTGSRLRIVDVGNFKIIDDSYNAAPTSMKSAITTLIKGEGKRKIAVLGDMNELGEMSREMHYEVGRFAAKSLVDVVVTVGEKAAAIADGAETENDHGKEPDKHAIVIRCKDTEEAYDRLRQIICDGDLILVKASRGMKLDELVQKIEKEGMTS